MSRILIIYATTEGQTQKIADFIADHVRAQSAEVVEQNVAQLERGFSMEGFDGVIVGGSLHLGKVQKSLRRFVSDHHETLTTLPNAFFLVSLTAVSERPEATAELEATMNHFVKDTGWKPDRAAYFAGALKYSQYGFITRLVMKSIAKREGTDTDTSHDYEYTRWDSVAEFAEDFVGSLPKAA